MGILRKWEFDLADAKNSERGYICVINFRFAGGPDSAAIPGAQKNFPATRNAARCHCQGVVCIEISFRGMHVFCIVLLNEILHHYIRSNQTNITCSSVRCALRILKRPGFRTLFMASINSDKVGRHCVLPEDPVAIYFFEYVTLSVIKSSCSRRSPLFECL